MPAVSGPTCWGRTIRRSMSTPLLMPPSPMNAMATATCRQKRAPPGAIPGAAAAPRQAGTENPTASGTATQLTSSGVRCSSPTANQASASRARDTAAASSLVGRQVATLSTLPRSAHPRRS